MWYYHNEIVFATINYQSELFLERFYVVLWKYSNRQVYSCCHSSVWFAFTLFDIVINYCYLKDFFVYFRNHWLSNKNLKIYRCVRYRAFPVLKKVFYLHRHAIEIRGGRCCCWRRVCNRVRACLWNVDFTHRDTKDTSGYLQKWNLIRKLSFP